MNHQRNPLSKPQTEFNPFFMFLWGLDPIVVCASSIRLLDRPKIHHLFAHKVLKPRSLKCVCRLPPVKLTSKSYSPSDSTFSDPTLKTPLLLPFIRPPLRSATALTKDGNGCDRGFSFVSAQCTNGVDTLIFPRSEFMQIKSEKMLKYANEKPE